MGFVWLITGEWTSDNKWTSTFKKLKKVHYVTVLCFPVCVINIAKPPKFCYAFLFWCDPPTPTPPPTHTPPHTPPQNITRDPHLAYDLKSFQRHTCILVTHSLSFLFTSCCLKNGKEIQDRVVCWISSVLDPNDGWHIQTFTQSPVSGRAVSVSQWAECFNRQR